MSLVKEERQSLPLSPAMVSIKVRPAAQKTVLKSYYLAATGREHTAIKCLNLGILESRVLNKLEMRRVTFSSLI